MNSSEKTRNERPKKPTKETEVLRTSHWFLSRRGPAFLDPIFRLGDQTIRRIKSYVEKGQVVADLGCGWGYYSFALADMVGPGGKVYAVDLAKKCILKIQRRAEKGGYRNIETYVSSASDLSIIKDRSVDFVFANGLLCSMAIDRQSAVTEIKRILKLNGHAYLSLGATPPLGYVDQTEWEMILQGFNVDMAGNYKEKWALVSHFSF